MLFYLTLHYSFDVPEGYDYYIVEIRDFDNSITDELDKCVNPEKPIEIPENTLYIRPTGSAKKQALKVVNKPYDKNTSSYQFVNPSLFIFEGKPSTTNNACIQFEFSELKDVTDVAKIIRTIYSCLETDEFNSLTWKKRKQMLRDHLSNVHTGIGIASSLMKLIPLKKH